jgi:hypothetical protein
MGGPGSGRKAGGGSYLKGKGLSKNTRIAKKQLSSSFSKASGRKVSVSSKSAKATRKEQNRLASKFGH